MFSIAAHRYAHIPVSKRFLTVSAIGFVAFGKSPRNTWIMPLRCIWHACIALCITIFSDIIIQTKNAGTMCRNPLVSRMLQRFVK